MSFRFVWLRLVLSRLVSAFRFVSFVSFWLVLIRLVRFAWVAFLARYGWARFVFLFYGFDLFRSSCSASSSRLHLVEEAVETAADITAIAAVSFFLTFI